MWKRKRTFCFWEVLSNQRSLKYGSILGKVGGGLGKRESTVPADEELRGNGSPGRAWLQVKFLL